MAKPRKTEQQHFVEGTKSKATQALESVYEAGRTKIPGHLSPAARAEFKRACKILVERGTATEGDFATLAVYAEVYARWVSAKKQLGNDFLVLMTIKDTNGVPKQVERPSPLLKVVETCEARLLTLAKSLGLTPDARDRVRKTRGKQEDAPVDPMEAFLNRQRPKVVPMSQEKIREAFESARRFKETASEDGPAGDSGEGN